jgi:hypothetical protein
MKEIRYYLYRRTSVQRLLGSASKINVVQEIRQLRDIPFFLQDFTDRHEGRYRGLQLPLPMRLV